MTTPTPQEPLGVCVFCKEDEAKLGRNKEWGVWRVRCGACGAKGPDCVTKIEAISSWNNVTKEPNQ